MIESFINIAAKKAGFEKYSVTQGIHLLPSWSKPLFLGEDIAVVYQFGALVNIASLVDLSTKKIAVIKSPDQRIDYTQVVTLNEVAGGVQLLSNVISIHRTELAVDLTNAAWSKIYTGHLLYFLIHKEEK